LRRTLRTLTTAEVAVDCRTVQRIFTEQCTFIMNQFQVFLARVQYLMSLTAVVVVLVYLAQHSYTPSTAIPADADREATVRVVGPKRIAVAPDAPFAKKLQISKVETAESTAPLVTVTGVVAACFHSGDKDGSGYWQFHTAELLAAHADWQKAIADVAFVEAQLVDTVQLADAQIVAAKEQSERMQRLVTIGTDTEKDLAEARAALIQAQIEGRKTVHEAQAAVRTAKQEEVILARQSAIVMQTNASRSSLMVDSEERR